MESTRQKKVARLIQKEMAEFFQKESRTYFNGAFITVTTVRISPDLGYAKIYLSIKITRINNFNSLYYSFLQLLTH